MRSKFRFFLWTIALIYLVNEILILIFTVWITKAIKTAFIIFFCFNVIYYIFIFVDLYKFEYCFSYCSLLFFLFNFSAYLIILSVNISKFFKYWKYCPYLLKDLDYNLHFERRCELYNINNNSRYLYQYICSYDSSKDFKKDKIICNSVKAINETNKVLYLFNNEYQKSNKYYCSRTNMPDNYSFVNHKKCKKANYSWMIALLVIYIFEYIFYYVILIFIGEGFHNYQNYRGRRRERTRNINRLENNEIQNNNSQTNIDTKSSENPYESNIFMQQKTRNIIIENKQEYSIDTNIKNNILNKENKKPNAISLDEISINISNTEKNEINNNNS